MRSPTVIVSDEFPAGYSSAGCSPVWGHIIHGQNAEGTERNNRAPGPRVIRPSNAVVLVSSPFVQCGPGLRDQNSGDASPPKGERSDPDWESA